MVRLTKINGQKFYVNSDLVEFVESTPDTLITLTTGKKMIVQETAEEVVEEIVQFKSKIAKRWETP